MLINLPEIMKIIAHPSRVRAARQFRSKWTAPERRLARGAKFESDLGSMHRYQNDCEKCFTSKNSNYVYAKLLTFRKITHILMFVRYYVIFFGTGVYS